MGTFYRIGFICLGILLIIYGFLGLIDVEVWIRNRGWIKLSLYESVFLFIVGSLLIIYMKRLKK